MECEEIELEFIHGTPDAFLLSDGDREEWIPVSQIEDAEMWHHYDKEKIYSFKIATWMLKDKGFI